MPHRTFSLIFNTSHARSTLAHCILFLLKSKNRGAQSCVGKGRRRQGVGSFVRSSYVSALCPVVMDSLRESSVKLGTIQRRLAWPLRKDDTHKSRSVNHTMPCRHLPLLVRLSGVMATSTGAEETPTAKAPKQGDGKVTYANRSTYDGQITLTYIRLA